MKLAETAFITGEVTNLSQAASKYGVSLSHLEILCAKEGWRERRGAFLKRVDEEAEELLATELIRAKRDSIRAHLARANALEVAGLARVNEGFGARDAASAVNAIKLASELERKVLGMDEEQSSVKVQVNVVPLIAMDSAPKFTEMVTQLGGKRGEDKPEA